MAANLRQSIDDTLKQVVTECYNAAKGAVLLLGAKSKRPVEIKPGKFMKWKGVSVRLDELIKHIRNDGNYGIKTGTVSGFDVCDIDTPESYPELVERLKKYTPYTSTGGGGFHFWFRHHPRVTKNKTAAIPGIDVKTADGYVVGPGSVHNETGAVYELFGRLEDAAEWPEDLLDMLFPDTPGRSPVSNPPAPLPPDSVTPYAAKALESAIETVQAAPEGQRNDTLNREAYGLGGLAHLGLDCEEVENVLIRAAITSGLSEGEARGTFKSGWTKGTMSPRTIENNQLPGAPLDWNSVTSANGIGHIQDESETSIEITGEEWPDPKPAVSMTSEVPTVEPEMLPSCLCDWILDAADRMQTAPDYMAVSACVMMGNLIGRQLVLRPKHYDNWVIYSNLWGCLVGNSSMMKTPAITETRKILDKIDQENIQAHNAAIMEWNPKMKKWDAANKAATKKAENPRTSEEERQTTIDSIPLPPEMPELKRIYTNSCTIQKLTVILKGNPNGILVLRDELAGWFRSFEKKGHEDDRPFYLEGWSGNGRYWDDTISRGSNHVEGLCIGVLGGATPGGMSTIVKETLGKQEGADGLLQRFGLIAYPANLDNFVWTDRPPDEKAFTAAETAFRCCAAVDLAHIQAERPPFPGSIPFLRFAPNAQEIYREWYTDLHQRLLHSEENDALISHLKKLNETVCGLALTFHVATYGVGPVGEVPILQAIRWAEYAEAHARKLYGLGCPETILLKRIEKGDLKDGFTAHDVHERDWSGLTISEAVDDALDKLVKNGHIRATGKRGPGRPTVMYLLHPKYRKK